MTNAESDPDSFLYQNVDSLDGPGLPFTSRPNLPVYRSPSTEQSAIALAEELQKAIQSGNERIAMDLAKLLAGMRLSFRASQERNSEIRAMDQEISVKIHICNKASTDNHITMKLRPTMTVETLKLVMYQKHGHLPELQKWIVGRRLAHDGDTLAECGVNFSGAVLFLYLITPTDSQALRIHDPVSGLTSVEATVIPPSSRQHEPTVAPTPVSPIFPSSFTPPISILTPPGGIQPQTIQAVQLLGSSPEKVGWACPGCTYINLPTRPGCEMCATDRPVTYAVPSDYAPTHHEMQMIRQDREFPVLPEDNYDDVDTIG